MIDNNGMSAAMSADASVSSSPPTSSETAANVRFEDLRIEEAPPAAFVTTHKPAKRSPPAPAGARRAWESTPRRGSDGEG